MKEPILTKKDMEDSSICGRKSNYKNGLYFLYDKQNQIIYIGQVGSTDDTSLYDRMIGHGDGSHSKKDKRWYNLVEYGRFHQFINLTKQELNHIERLAISCMNQAIYNDGIDVTQTAIDNILKKIL